MNLNDSVGARSVSFIVPLILCGLLGAVTIARAQAPGTFYPAGNLIQARTNATTTLLKDGRVLIAGGQGAGPGFARLASAEIYNPITGTFSSTGNMFTPRSNHAAVLLPD